MMSQLKTRGFLMMDRQSQPIIFWEMWSQILMEQLVQEIGPTLLLEG